MMLVEMAVRVSAGSKPVDSSAAEMVRKCWWFGNTCDRFILMSAVSTRQTQNSIPIGWL